jgi:hypothetical protein
MKARARPTKEAAETLAVQALAFIAEDTERMSGFLNATGVAPDQIRSAARESGFLAGVLDHMLGDESLLIAFADSAALDPSEVARARSALGGRRERDVP